MRFFSFFKKKRERHSEAFSAFVNGLKRDGAIGDDYQSQAKEGYSKNVIAFACISRISLAVANMPRIVFVKGKEVEKDHPVAKLINRPNPKESGKELRRIIVMHRLISGNAYLHSVDVVAGKKRVAELTALRPDRVKIKVNSSGVPVAYEHSLNSKTETFPIDPITMVSDVLHTKEPNPLDDLYGLSPIGAASMGISQHNESSIWNLSLLSNAAKPSGVMTLKSPGPGAAPPDIHALTKLTEDFNEKFSGKKNAGKIPFLTFDMVWQSLGMSPTDMDWINGKNSTARDIALALGYPPYLLGMAEGSTFANVREAKLSLYQETVVPLAQSIDEAISNWLSLKSNEEIEIKPDLDAVEALAPQREPMLEQSRMDFESGIITLNEARAMRNYDPIDNGDDVLIPSGKLPLGFDPTSMNDESFSKWLIREGLSEDRAKEICQSAN